MAQIVDSIVITLLWTIFAVLEGTREAHYYDAAVKMDKLHSNIHWMYLVQRSIVLFVIGITMCTAVLPISLALIFPYIHDGSYYAQRNDLNKDVYRKRFKAESTTSTAFFEFTYKERIVLSITGIFLFILYIVLKNSFICV